MFLLFCLLAHQPAGNVLCDRYTTCQALMHMFSHLKVNPLSHMDSGVEIYTDLSVQENFIMLAHYILT